MPATKTTAKSKTLAKCTVSSMAPRSVDARLVRLSDPEMKPAMEALKERISKDKDFALSLLKSAGIATAKGKLSKRFGG